MPWSVVEKVDEAVLSKVQQSLKDVKVPQWNDRVRKVECVLSFDNPESPDGLFVSLSDFQGYGDSYMQMIYEKTNKALFLNIKWKKIPKPQAEKTEEAPTKMAIGVEGGFQTEDEQFEYEKTHYIAVMPDRILIPFPNTELPDLIQLSVDGILNASDLSADEAQVMAWEEKRQVSKYAANLVQLDNGKKLSPDPSTWRCEDSGVGPENLWLNLSDGYIGSGRAQVDATGKMGGGTGAALRHYEAEKAKGNNYPLCVKLGTITPSGADVYSYAPDEDDMVEVPNLGKLLSHWGVNMMQMEKTEKTMAELQIDMNMKFDFDKICEEGKELVPRKGAGFVGLKNLGNSCYVASVMQVMCTLPEIKERYVDRADQIFQSVPIGKAPEDFTAQMAKLGVGLITDKYAKGGEEQDYIAPTMFKFLVGKGHPEFSTGNQQDAYEYFSHLMERMARAERTDQAGMTPTAKLFDFVVEERLEANGKVRYRATEARDLSMVIPLEAAENKAEVQSYEERTAKRQKGEDGDPMETDAKEEPVKAKIPFLACVQNYVAPTHITDWKMPGTGEATVAKKSTRFKTFPKYLVCHMRRYIVGEDWRPKKLDVLVPAPETLDLSEFRSTGLQPGEETMPEDESGGGGGGSGSNRVVPDEGLVAQLMSMGFAENGCKRAAIATNNASAEAAMEWVLMHMEDADFNDPIPEENPAPAGGAATFSAESVDMLCALGFQKNHAERALKETNGDLERAGDWLMSRADNLDALMEAEESAPAPSAEANAPPQDYKPQYELLGFISHIGSNTACGHYVCHIKKDGKWTIFNDRKVAESAEPPFALGYMYIYKSVGPA